MYCLIFLVMSVSEYLEVIQSLLGKKKKRQKWNHLGYIFNYKLNSKFLEVSFCAVFLAVQVAWLCF